MTKQTELPPYMNSAANPKMQDEEAALRQAFTLYDQAWQENDVNTILSYYHYPCMLLSSVGVLVKNSEEELRPFITTIVDDMKLANYGRSTIDEVSVKQLSNTIAMVSMHAVRFNVDDDKIGEGVTTYTFTKADGSWKIALLAPHDVETMPRYC